MNLNKITALFMSICLLTGVTAFPVCASDYSVDKSVVTSTSEVSVTSDNTEDTRVYTYVDGNFSVIIPKKVILSGKKGKGTYQVDVYGDIAAEDYITVEPDSSVTLSSAGKDDIKADITQSRTVFTYSDGLNRDTAVTAQGTIETSGLSAGAWSGVFYFNINYVSTLNYYSSLELAVADANNLTTDNADVKSIYDDNAVAALVIENDTAYITMLQSESDAASMTISVDTTINLNSQSVVLAEGEGIKYNENLTVIGGNISGSNTAYVLKNSTNKTAALTLSSVNISDVLSEDYSISNNITMIGGYGSLYMYNSKSEIISNVPDEATIVYEIDENDSGDYSDSDVEITALSSPKNIYNIYFGLGQEMVIEDCDITAYSEGANPTIAVYGNTIDNVNITDCYIEDEAKGELVYARSVAMFYCNTVSVSNCEVYATTYNIPRYITLEAPDKTEVSFYMMHQSVSYPLYITGKSSSYTTATINGGYYSIEKGTNYPYIEGVSAGYSVDVSGSVGLQTSSAAYILYTNLSVKDDVENLTMWGGNNALSLGRSNADIYGGKFKAPAHGGSYITFSSNVNIYGGLFYNNAVETDYMVSQGLYDISETSEMICPDTGETITVYWSPEGALYSYTNVGTINIYDGTFVSAASQSVRMKNYSESDSGVINLYGGLIISDNGAALACDSYGTINVYDGTAFELLNDAVPWTTAASKYINNFSIN